MQSPFNLPDLHQNPPTKPRHGIRRQFINRARRPNSPRRLGQYCILNQPRCACARLLQYSNRPPSTVNGALPPFLPGRFRVINAASMMP